MRPQINEIVALRGKLPQAVVGKRFGIEQTDVSQIQRTHKGRMMKQDDKQRAKEVEVVLPIVYGSCAFWLGKKADEYATHRWTVYVRAADNGDLGSVVKKVVFQLHQSFSHPTRIVERAPFVLSECGWGEFEVGITIMFHADAAEMHAELTHHLRLYPEGDSSSPLLSTKRPVVSERYDELVFCEPQLAFFHRIRGNPMLRIHGSEAAVAQAGTLAAQQQTTNVGGAPPSVPSDPPSDSDPRGDTLDHPLAPWFIQFSDEQELATITAARQQVAALRTKLDAEYAALEAECQELRQRAAH